MLVMSSVKLNAIRRPIMSAPSPQKKLPKHSPTKRELIVYRTVFSEMSNSCDSAGSVSETP